MKKRSYSAQIDRQARMVGNTLSRYVGVWVSMSCAILLLLIQQLRNVYGFRGERGQLLLPVPVPIGRKRLLALRVVALFAALTYTILVTVSAYIRQENTTHALFLLVSFLLILAFLWTGFSFVPTRLYENGILDQFGFTDWSRLSYGEERARQFRLWVRERDFSKSAHLRKDVFLFCAAEQQDRVKDILKERVGVKENPSVDCKMKLDT